MTRARLLPIVVAIVSALSLWLTSTRLRISQDLSVLFPSKGDAAALARFTRVFGGGDVAMGLVRGADASEVEAASRELAEDIASRPSTLHLVRMGAPRDRDPTLAWTHAGPAARARLERAVSPEGMRDRLEGTRALLLAPTGAEEAEEWLSRDPLRLAEVPWEGRGEIAGGLPAAQDGALVADEGRARVVVWEPKGSAFEKEPAARAAADARASIDKTRASHPSVTIDLAGGHALADGTERMMRRDLIMSSSISTVLAALVFVATFRRVRALVAVLPPLALGTLWTTAIAAFFPAGLSAIAIAFAAVVVGVGVDTGVHVYAALLEGRRRGMAPAEAARFARRTSARPTMTAAVAAGLAFGALALSELEAVAQLGILCGVGEVLTAVAILLVTPEIGAWLERGPAPPALAPRWRDAVAWLSATKRRAATTLAFAVLPLVAVIVLGWPRAGDALVAIRPRALEPLRTQEAIRELFGGKSAGQWIVLSVDRDRDRAWERSDAVAEALDQLTAGGAIDGYDALAALAPAPSTQRIRLARRDALDLPSRVADLEAALRSAGISVDACEPALEAFRHPSHVVASPDLEGDLAWLASRHLRHDETGADWIAAAYVRPLGDAAADARALAAIRAADPGVIVTGYSHLEAALRASLARDLPRIGIIAVVVVAIALRTALRSVREVFVALTTLAVELAAVGLTMRLLSVRWHVYDALVLPILIGITIDESMFLLHARDGEDPLRAQGPLVAATGLTTAAGFAALLTCRFEGLWDLGAVGTLGVVYGLVAALVVVPCGLRFARPAN